MLYTPGQKDHREEDAGHNENLVDNLHPHVSML